MYKDLAKRRATTRIRVKRFRERKKEEQIMYKDPDKQRKAVREATQRHRLRKKLEKIKEVGPIHSTIQTSDFIQKEISRLEDNLNMWRNMLKRPGTIPVNSSLGGGDTPINDSKVEGIKSMSSEQTVKCPICGRPYVTYSHYAGDRSACPECRSEARAERGKWRTITTDNTKIES
jgi:hypothetical protein